MIVAGTTLLGTQYVGVSVQGWQLIFGGVQAISIASAVVFGSYQLMELRRTRMAESLEKLHPKFIGIVNFTTSVIYGLPTFEGNTLKRAEKFAAWVGSCLAVDAHGAPISQKRYAECIELLDNAREVVHTLSDISAYLEKRIIREHDFFRQYLSRMLELYYLLEPYVLLVSVARSFRWGLRIRRLGIGSVRYLTTSKNNKGVRPALRGVEIYEPLLASIADVPWHRVRRGRFIPHYKKLVERDTKSIREVEKSVTQHAYWPRAAEVLAHV